MIFFFDSDDDVAEDNGEMENDFLLDMHDDDDYDYDGFDGVFDYHDYEIFPSE